MSEHTKGPWKLAIGERKQARINGGDWQGLAKIYTCLKYSHPDDPCNDAGKANARLIVAAPDLLEALKEAVDRMEQVGELVDGRQFIPQCSAAIALAQTAINKAEGR